MSGGNHLSEGSGSELSTRYSGRPRGRWLFVWDKFVTWFRPHAERKARIANEAAEARLLQEVHKAQLIAAQAAEAAASAAEKNATALKTTVEAFAAASSLPPEERARLSVFLKRTAQRLDYRTSQSAENPPERLSDEEVDEGIEDWFARVRDFEARTGTRVDIEFPGAGPYDPDDPRHRRWPEQPEE